MRSTLCDGAAAWRVRRRRSEFCGATVVVWLTASLWTGWPEAFDWSASEQFPQFPYFPPARRDQQLEPTAITEVAATVAPEVAATSTARAEAATTTTRPHKTLREYQKECVDCAIQNNTIVVLPTGAGKTLIAVKVIDHFRRTRPSQVVVFMVPKVVLVSQQAAYCKGECEAEEAVKELCGRAMERWDDIKWRSTLRNNTVLVGTPEVFRQALDKGFLHPGNMSLLIFDECQSARRKDAMVRIMKDHIAPAPPEERPRILGLTASFAPGAATQEGNVKQQKIELELLLQAKMVFPNISGDEAAVLSGPKTWHTVHWPVENLDEHFGADVAACVDALMKDVDPEGQITGLNQTILRIRHVLMQLGMQGFDYAMKYNVMRSIAQKFPEKREKLKNYSDPCAKHEALKDVPTVSNKAKTLLELLTDLCAKGKGFVFVTQTIVTAPLADMINRSLTECRALALYGKMSQGEQTRALQSFKGGEVQVLVATDAGQEGIDVPDCEWVVRFDKFNTTMSHIQGSGRARKSAAQVYYFDNDPVLEQERASRMFSVAGDNTVRATDDLRQAVDAQEEERRAKAKGVHPFEEPGAQNVHFGNGYLLVYKWAWRVCNASFPVHRLIEWAPKEEGGGLIRVTIPGPDGWFPIESAEVDEYWGDVRLEDLWDAAKLTRKQRQERRALFVAAVRLRKMEWLDKTNTPRTPPLMQAQQNASKTCANATQPLKHKIGKTFGTNSIDRRLLETSSHLGAAERGGH